MNDNTNAEKLLCKFNKDKKLMENYLQQGGKAVLVRSEFFLTQNHSFLEENVIWYITVDNLSFLKLPMCLLPTKFGVFGGESESSCDRLKAAPNHRLCYRNFAKEKENLRYYRRIPNEGAIYGEGYRGIFVELWAPYENENEFQILKTFGDINKERVVYEEGLGFWFFVNVMLLESRPEIKSGDIKLKESKMIKITTYEKIRKIKVATIKSLFKEVGKELAPYADVLTEDELVASFNFLNNNAEADDDEVADVALWEDFLENSPEFLSRETLKELKVKEALVK